MTEAKREWVIKSDTRCQEDYYLRNIKTKNMKGVSKQLKFCLYSTATL